jgi:medium-chain acyl-[acyl-carrier-protein] hydrolase
VWPEPRAAVRLFCFPFAGAGIFAYSRWAEHLAPDVEVATVQLPGREERVREPSPSHVGEVVGPIADWIAAHAAGPYALFGHSLGALIAFELARELRRRAGTGPVQVFVSARMAPHALDPAPPLHRLSDQMLVQRLRQLGGTPPHVLDDEDLMGLLLPGLRADFAMNETYRFTPEAPLDIPVTAFGGTEDVRVSWEDVAGWRLHTRGRFRLRMLPGDHFFLVTQLPRLAREIASALMETRYGC